MSKVPEIRLKGFEGEWEESVLKDELSDDIKTNTLARAFLSDSDGEVLNVHYGDVLIKYGSLLNATEDDIPHITGSTAKDYCDFLQNGDVIFADTAEDETAGKCVEIENVGDKKIVSGLHTIACRPKEQFGEGYLGYYLNSPKYHDQLLPLLQGIKVFSLNKSQLEQTTMFMPQSVSEQKSIGSFFSSFDRLISGHQQRLENLRRVNKSMLQKMFPQQGQTVPEIRFKGFEGEWKRKRLGDVLEVGNGCDYKHLNEGNVPVYGTGGIITFVDDYLYDGETVCIGRKGTIDLPIYHKGKIWTVDTLFYTYNIDCNVRFLYYLFCTIDWKMYNEATGVPSLSKENIKKIVSCFPEKDEQRQIASFFTSLDNLINQEVKYIDQLNRVKHTLLQKMFV